MFEQPTTKYFNNNNRREQAPRQQEFGRNHHHHGGDQRRGAGGASNRRRKIGMLRYGSDSPVSTKTMHRTREHARQIAMKLSEDVGGGSVDGFGGVGGGGASTAAEMPTFAADFGNAFGGDDMAFSSTHSTTHSSAHVPSKAQSETGVPNLFDEDPFSPSALQRVSSAPASDVPDTMSSSRRRTSTSSTRRNGRHSSGTQSDFHWPQSTKNNNAALDPHFMADWPSPRQSMNTMPSNSSMQASFVQRGVQQQRIQPKPKNNIPDAASPTALHTKKQQQQQHHPQHSASPDAVRRSLVQNKRQQQHPQQQQLVAPSASRLSSNNKQQQRDATRVPLQNRQQQRTLAPEASPRPQKLQQQQLPPHSKQWQQKQHQGLTPSPQTTVSNSSAAMTAKITRTPSPDPRPPSSAPSPTPSAGVAARRRMKVQMKANTNNNRARSRLRSDSDSSSGHTPPKSPQSIKRFYSTDSSSVSGRGGGGAGGGKPSDRVAHYSMASQNPLSQHAGTIKPTRSIASSTRSEHSSNSSSGPNIFDPTNPNGGFTFDAFGLDAKQMNREVSEAMHDIAGAHPDLSFFIAADPNDDFAAGRWDSPVGSRSSSPAAEEDGFVDGFRITKTSNLPVHVRQSPTSTERSSLTSESSDNKQGGSSGGVGVGGEPSGSMNRFKAQAGFHASSKPRRVVRPAETESPASPGGQVRGEILSKHLRPTKQDADRSSTAVTDGRNIPPVPNLDDSSNRVSAVTPRQQQPKAEQSKFKRREDVEFFDESESEYGGSVGAESRRASEGGASDVASSDIPSSDVAITPHHVLAKGVASLNLQGLGSVPSEVQSKEKATRPMSKQKDINLFEEKKDESVSNDEEEQSPEKTVGSLRSHWETRDAAQMKTNAKRILKRQQSPHSLSREAVDRLHYQLGDDIRSPEKLERTVKTRDTQIEAQNYRDGVDEVATQSSTGPNVDRPSVLAQARLVNNSLRRQRSDASDSRAGIAVDFAASDSEDGITNDIPRRRSSDTGAVKRFPKVSGSPQSVENETIGQPGRAGDVVDNGSSRETGATFHARRHPAPAVLNGSNRPIEGSATIRAERADLATATRVTVPSEVADKLRRRSYDAAQPVSPFLNSAVEAELQLNRSDVDSTVSQGSKGFRHHQPRVSSSGSISPKSRHGISTAGSLSPTRRSQTCSQSRGGDEHDDCSKSEGGIAIKKMTTLLSKLDRPTIREVMSEAGVSPEFMNVRLKRTRIGKDDSSPGSRVEESNGDGNRSLPSEDQRRGHQQDCQDTQDESCGAEEPPKKLSYRERRELELQREREEEEARRTEKDNNPAQRDVASLIKRRIAANKRNAALSAPSSPKREDPVEFRRNLKPVTADMVPVKVLERQLSHIEQRISSSPRRNNDASDVRMSPDGRLSPTRKIIRRRPSEQSSHSMNTNSDQSDVSQTQASPRLTGPAVSPVGNCVDTEQDCSEDGSSTWRGPLHARSLDGAVSPAAGRGSSASPESAQTPTQRSLHTYPSHSSPRSLRSARRSPSRSPRHGALESKLSEDREGAQGSKSIRQCASPAVSRLLMLQQIQQSEDPHESISSTGNILSKASLSPKNRAGSRDLSLAHNDSAGDEALMTAKATTPKATMMMLNAFLAGRGSVSSDTTTTKADPCGTEPGVGGGSSVGQSEPVGEDGPPALKDDPKYERYFKMLKLGMPMDVVKHALTRDGHDPSVMDGDHNKPAGIPLKDDPTYSKYFKMLSIGLPMEAVKHSMERDGLDCHVMDQDHSLPAKAGGKPDKEPKEKDSHRRARLHWNTLWKVTRNSLWAKIDQDDELGKIKIDEDEFQELFQAERDTTVAPKAGANAVANKRGAVRVIDPKRANNGGIVLARLKMSHDEMADAVDRINDGSITAEQIEHMIEYLPTKEERKALEAYMLEGGQDAGEKFDGLCECEKFMVSMMTVKHAKRKVQALLFKLQFETCLSDIESDALTVELACDELSNSVRLRRLLGIVLTFGNRLNTAGNGKRKAGAFTLDSLLKLHQAKAFDKKTTFLNYIVLIVQRNNELLLRFKDDLPTVFKADKIFWDQCVTDLEDVENQLENVRKISLHQARQMQAYRVKRKKNQNRTDEDEESLDEADISMSLEEEVEALRATPIGIFTLGAIKYVSAVRDRVEDTNGKFSRLLEYFGEEENKMQTHDLFSTIVAFSRDFDKAKEEVFANEKKKQREERKRQVGSAAKQGRPPTHSPPITERKASHSMPRVSSLQPTMSSLFKELKARPSAPPADKRQSPPPMEHSSDPASILAETENNESLTSERSVATSQAPQEPNTTGQNLMDDSNLSEVSVEGSGDKLPQSSSVSPPRRNIASSTMRHRARMRRHRPEVPATSSTTPALSSGGNDSESQQQPQATAMASKLSQANETCSGKTLSPTRPLSPRSSVRHKRRTEIRNSLQQRRAAAVAMSDAAKRKEKDEG